MNKKIDTFKNNYSKLREKYEEKYHESFNQNPYDSINNHPLTDLKYKVSIVMATWNSGNTIKYTLRSIENTYICNNFNDKLEVVIVDDGSDDDTFDIINDNSYNFKIKYIRQEHLGKPSAVNIGVYNSTGDIIILTDSDIIYFPFTLDEIIKRQQEYLNDAIFFGFRQNIQKEDITKTFINEDIYSFKPVIYDDYRLKENHSESFGISYMLETNSLLNYDGNKSITVDGWDNFSYQMVFGFLLSISKENFVKIGGIKEFIKGYGYEDSAVAAECMEQGINIIPVPSAIALHIFHPFRTNTQNEDCEKNRKRLIDYLKKTKRLSYVKESNNKRIVDRYDYESNKKIKKVKKFVIKNGDLEKARTFYYINSLEESRAIYLKFIRSLNKDELENLFDICIRLNDEDTFNKLLKVKGIENCFYYYLANYYFNELVIPSDLDKPFANGTKYLKYINYTNPNYFTKTANKYFKEKSYYLAYQYYFAAKLKTSEMNEECDKCIKLIKSRN